MSFFLPQNSWLHTILCYRYVTHYCSFRTWLLLISEFKQLSLKCSNTLCSSKKLRKHIDMELFVKYRYISLQKVDSSHSITWHIFCEDIFICWNELKVQQIQVQQVQKRIDMANHLICTHRSCASEYSCMNEQYSKPTIPSDSSRITKGQISVFRNCYV